jgi:pimeloyl-ACP methyl ester carboxylesterase
MDLKELMVHLEDSERRVGLGWKAIGGSLGAAILWCYAELFTTKPFTHMIFVDQAPLQNSTLDGWDSRFCNRGMNSAMSLASLQTTLALSPETAHKGTINACLAYRAYPLATDTQTFEDMEADKEFFLGEAMKGDGEWYGKLMADHTSLDWRDSIRASFGTGSGSVTKVFVVTSSRSGCFPPAGPMKVVDLVGEKANGVVVDWGGHWCYWEDPRKFEELCLEFLETEE